MSMIVVSTSIYAGDVSLIFSVVVVKQLCSCNVTVPDLEKKRDFCDVSFCLQAG